MSKSLREQVAVLGVGCTKFGDNVDQSLSDMMVDAAQAACQDAGVTHGRAPGRVARDFFAGV